MEAHYRFRLLEETFFIAVNVFDRYIAKKPVTKEQVPILSIACLLLSSKYEDIYPPELKEMMKLLDKEDQARI
jgi:hypothetical protein